MFLKVAINIQKTTCIIENFLKNSTFFPPNIKFIIVYFISQT